jgi:hypothetical protein
MSNHRELQRKIFEITLIYRQNDRFDLCTARQQLFDPYRQDVAKVISPVIAISFPPDAAVRKLKLLPIANAGARPILGNRLRADG